mmetsp:Transcript_91528/g.245167  ORF Transcript_91528/g.245167 Transcript_91528/m.245167 type:complete len:305 (-) Transcript_91528:682-1596(-)
MVDSFPNSSATTIKAPARSAVQAQLAAVQSALAANQALLCAANYLDVVQRRPKLLNPQEKPSTAPESLHYPDSEPEPAPEQPPEEDEIEVKKRMMEQLRKKLKPAATDSAFLVARPTDFRAIASNLKQDGPDTASKPRPDPKKNRNLSMDVVPPKNWSRKNAAGGTSFKSGVARPGDGRASPRTSPRTSPKASPAAAERKPGRGDRRIRLREASPSPEAEAPAVRSLAQIGSKWREKLRAHVVSSRFTSRAKKKEEEGPRFCHVGPRTGASPNCSAKARTAAGEQGASVPGTAEEVAANQVGDA